MRENLEFCLEFHLKPFVIVEAGEKTERNFSRGFFHGGVKVAVGD